MQKQFYIFFLSLCCSFLFTACSSDEKISPEVLRYGEPDTISLGFNYRSVVSDLADTKAPVVVNETAVNNVNLYVFNQLGDVITHEYLLNSSTLQDIVIYRNMKYRVYAVVNVGVNMPAKTMAELEGFVKTISDITQVADASAGVLMSGKTDLQLLTNGQSIQVDLTRCVSKFILKCDYTQLNPDVKITVTRVQLKNAPARLLLFGESKAASGEVIDGEERTGADLVPLSGSGATFYLFENMQGQVAPSALSYKQKEGGMSAQAKANSSYIEMVYDYLSASKSGTIIYRFYMGNTYSDCNIKRNTQYTCTVLFKGDGSAGENSWSVDNSALVDLVTGITLTPTSHKFTLLGDRLPIMATVFPATANNKALAWSSSNTAVATVDDLGNVTSVGDGTCTITATSTDGTNLSATCAIEVNSKIYVTGVTVTPQTLTMFTGTTEQLTATLLPSDAWVNTVSWSSSNTAVATVDASGKVTAVAVGTADITVMSTDDNSKKAICKVTVQSKEFTISPLSKTLYVGESFAISYSVKPPALPTFVSGNTGVATVDANGTVTAVAAGTTNITVSVHGLSATCAVTVVKPEIAFPYPNKIMYDGEIITIPYSKLVPNTAVPTVTCSAPGTVEILESSSAGVKIKALAEGNATITATVAGVNATCAITVEKLRIVPTESNVTIYTHFNKDLGYTILPAHAASLGIIGSHANSSDATYFVFPEAGTPNRIQGKVANSGSLPVKLSITGRPDVTATVYCTVKPCLQVNDSEFLYGTVDILANAYISKQNHRTYSDIYVKRQVSYTAAPQATVVWDCNKPGVIIDKGLIYTSDTSPANGPGYYVTVSVTGDDGVVTSFTNANGISFYEEIYLTFEGNGTLVGEDGSSGEMLPLFEVLFENLVSLSQPGAPIKKEVIPDGLKFNGMDWTYTLRTKIYGAAGDTEYIQITPVTVTQDERVQTKYKEPNSKVLKYFITY